MVLPSAIYTVLISAKPPKLLPFVIHFFYPCPHFMRYYNMSHKKCDKTSKVKLVLDKSFHRFKIDFFKHNVNATSSFAIIIITPEF